MVGMGDIFDDFCGCLLIFEKTLKCNFALEDIGNMVVVVKVDFGLLTFMVELYAFPKDLCRLPFN